MPFKIIKTLENNKPQLSICPSNWEKNGKLKWPKKQSEKLVKNEHSTAKPDWQEFECSVKRTNLTTYQTAENELRIMLAHTDTEQDEEELPRARVSQHRRPRTRPTDIIDINDLAYQLAVPQSESNNTNDHGITVEADLSTSNTYEIVIPNTPPPTQLTGLDSNNILKDILNNQNIIFEATNNIIANQKKIFHELASLSVQIDENVKNIKVTTLAEASSSRENENINIRQIKTQSDLDFTELLLADPEQKNMMITGALFICTGGPGTAKNCAYRLIDVLFARDFLCQCSWSGSSRTEGVKISLKSYKKTLSFFYEVIKHWDKTYTIEENDTFFKNILKNSNKRKNATGTRTSTKRRRAAKSNDIQPSNDNQPSIDEEDEDERASRSNDIQPSNDNQPSIDEEDQDERASRSNDIQLSDDNQPSIDEEDEDGLC